MMDEEETRAKYDTKHQWLCDGIVLKLEDPAGQHNNELFKVLTILSEVLK